MKKTKNTRNTTTTDKEQQQIAVDAPTRKAHKHAILDHIRQRVRLVHDQRLIHANPSLAFEVIAPRSEDGVQDVVSLESVMYSLVLNTQEPIALEIAGTATRKQFIVRTSSNTALAHAKQQLLFRYPQAEIRHLDAMSDPLRLAPSETAAVVELLPGAAAFLPMRQWDLHKQKGIDPLLGVLAALSTVPVSQRAVAQICLLPAAPTWSKQYQRKAIENALEPERVERQEKQAQSRTSDGGPGTMGLIVLGFILLLLIIFTQFKRSIPAWVGLSLKTLLLQGHLPALTGAQHTQFIAGVGVLLVVLVSVAILIGFVKQRFGKTLYDQRLVAQRTGQMAYRGCIRLYVLGPIASKEHHTLYKEQKQARQAALNALVAAYRQFHTASAGYFVPQALSERRARHLVGSRTGYHASWRSSLPAWAQGVRTSRHFFTGDFLSSAWQLPQRADLGELSGFLQKRLRTLPFPPALVHETERRVWDTCPGVCVHSGVTHPFVIPPGFFGNHTFLGGKSGEGKSTMMVHLASAVAKEGQRGFFLLDPHGDLADDVLRMVPQDRLEEVVLIDLGERDFCVGLNPLDVTLGRDRDLVVASLISVFSHIWKTSWGPRMEAPFRAAVMTLFEANTTLVQRDSLHGPDQQYTLLDVVQVLTDESFCHDLLNMTEDLFIHRFWYEYYSPLSLIQQRDRIDPVLTKMMQFESKIARRILGQSRSTIRLHELVQQQNMIIVRLAFSEAGAQTGSLIGAILLGLLMVTLREQSRLAVEERARMVLFLDEFQTFGGGADISQLLAELRKYGGSAVMATQSLEYLTAIDPALLPTIQANTKQYILFRLSATDAVSIAPELDITPADLVNLDTYTCYVRMVYANQQQPTFSLHIQRPVLGPEEQVNTIRQYSQRTYCRPAEGIEKRLIEALGRAVSASTSHQQHEVSTNRPSSKSSAPGAANSTPESRATATSSKSTDASPKEEPQNIQFAAKAKNRKKGQVTSFTQFPYTETGEQETNEGKEQS